MIHSQKIAKTIGISLIFLLLISCGGKPPAPIPKPNPKRTILVYVGGDNNLSSEVKDTKEALLYAWNPKTMGNLLLFADSYKGVPVLIQIKQKNNKNVADTVKIYKNTNSADAALLKEVIADMKKIAPSHSYGMSLFSHATGWLPPGAFTNPERWGTSKNTRSIFVDGNDEMEYADFVDAIPENTFDFMVFDMCFMSSVETIYPLRKKTPYMVVSAAEILSPGFIPILKNNLGLLYETKPKLIDFAKEFFHYFTNLNGQYRSATISVIKTDEIEALADMSKKILANGSTFVLNNIQFFDRNGAPHLFFDYGNYMNEIATYTQFTELEAQLKKLILYKQNTDILINIDIKKHSGLSTYIRQGNLPAINAAYLNTEWAKKVLQK